MIQFIGHFHPLLVHLPIGILLLAFVLECMARWFQQDQVQPAIRWALLFGLLTSVLSAGSGWFLADGGGYDEQLLWQHRWWGVGTVCMFGLVWLLQKKSWYFPAFTVAVAALVVTGHFGGNLTHGANYLFENQSDATPVAMAEVKSISLETPVFSGIIQPILQEKCVSCHRPEKRKGDLVLSTQEGILAGGKHGQILLPGNPDSSKLLQRIFLPLHHDDHMPPSGKAQLSDLEIKLLSWWISEGADFQGNLQAHPLPADLKKTLDDTQAAPVNPVFSLKVPMPSNEALQALKALNIKVQSLGTGQPWLAVSLAGQKALTGKHWEALQGVSAQLVDLDLSHTEVSDQALSGKTFPHLVELNLGHTAVGSGALSMLKKATYLESLNLTNTLTDNGLQDVLPKLPHLKKVFLWQSKTTQEAVTAWKQQFPKVTFETGADIPDDLPLTLRVPKMLYGRSFFDDTMHVDLSFPFKGVEIYYTLDEAASPTTQSPKFKETIVLDKTAHLRAFAAKEGWQNSPLVEAMFVRKKYSIASATIVRPPSPKYPAKGAASLIDGKIADAQGADTWLGYEGDHLDAILDIGEVKELEQLFVHCLENNGPWIFKPVGIQVSSSLDGKTFKPVAAQKFAMNTSMGEQKVHLLGCPFPQKIQARYLKVRVESALKCPPWHPGKGGKCWIFVDEMTVE